MKKLIAVLMLALATPVLADKSDTTINNYFDTTVEEYITENTTVSSNNINGIALSIATAQHHFDFGTKVWQGSVGVGNYGNKFATSFAAAKKFNRVLINISIGKEEGSAYGFGAGGTWRF